MTEQAIVTRHLCIRGTVQGVGFRWNMLQAAQDLALAGWVRNRSDGSVEAVVHGPQDAVAAMIHWASNGPAGARVDAVTVEEWKDHELEHAGFVQLPTI